jgi:hypothetical protein
MKQKTSDDSNANHEPLILFHGGKIHFNHDLADIRVGIQLRLGE